MNFLSHYYFERYALDPHQVFGGFLPDLLKNVDKNYFFQIQKHEHLLDSNPNYLAITTGWKRHLEVDKVFHSSPFFYEHTHRLRKDIEDVVRDLPIRPSFLAHIALELLLDHLLIAYNVLSVARLYDHLENIDKYSVKSYLKVFDRIDEDRFFRFYDRFVEARYIANYANIENIPHALYNICKRIWIFEASTSHLDELAVRLDDYKNNHLKNYFNIYIDIQQTLN